jgi:hypothetical protein
MGATEPYSRNITLSSPNGHPQLNITDVSIFAVTGKAGSRRVPGYSYGAAIYAYNRSKVTATLLSFSRTSISSLGFSLGGPTEIGCYGESSVLLNGVKVESMLAYGNANVTAYGGTVGAGGLSSVLLGLYNSSEANFYGVTFPTTVVADYAHLVLSHCSQLSGTRITSTGHSRVDLINGTTMTAIPAVVSGLVTTLPCINATGDSTVYFLSSRFSQTSITYGGPAVSVYDNATFVAQQSVMSLLGVLAFDNSSVLFNNTTTVGSLANIEIIGNGSSSISVSGCSLVGSPDPVTIKLSGSSHISFVNSLIVAGYLVFSDNSTAYISSTDLTQSSRIIAQENASVTVVGDSIVADSIEMMENARLSLESSSVSLVYCLDSSQASSINCSVTELSVSGNSTVRLMSSIVRELSLAESNVTGSLSGLTSFLENSTLALSGTRCEASVLNTTVNNLDFSFSGNSNVTISDSTLRNISLQGSSVVTLKNASVSAGFSVLGSSIVRVYPSLRVHCVDYFGNPLSGSVVTVNTNPGGLGGVTRETADKSGWANFVFFSGVVNATGSFPIGYATVSGSFGGVSTSKSLSLALIGKDVTLSLPLPWWSLYVLPVIILVGVVAFLACVGYAYKRVSARRAKRQS